jgi:hypothetical protein
MSLDSLRQRAACSPAFFRFDSRRRRNNYIMETAQLIQAAASIATAMAASRYGKFGGMEDSRIADIAVIAVKIARAIEVEAIKNV